MHATGLLGVLSIVLVLPWLLERQLTRIVRTNRWNNLDELRIYGNFYVGFTKEWFRFFLLQHFVFDVFLIIVEVLLMSEPLHMTIVTVSTIAIYMGLILVYRPFHERIELILDLVLGTIAIFASALSLYAETYEGEENEDSNLHLPTSFTVGLYSILAVQVQHISYGNILVMATY